MFENLYPFRKIVQDCIKMVTWNRNTNMIADSCSRVCFVTLRVEGKQSTLFSTCRIIVTHRACCHVSSLALLTHAFIACCWIFFLMTIFSYLAMKIILNISYT